MDSAKATFFRAELARTPSEFMPLDAAAIQAELERRWDEKHGIITLDEKLSEEDAKGNSLTYCGQSLLGHRRHRGRRHRGRQAQARKVKGLARGQG